MNQGQGFCRIFCFILSLIWSLQLVLKRRSCKLDFVLSVKPEWVAVTFFIVNSQRSLLKVKCWTFWRWFHLEEIHPFFSLIWLIESENIWTLLFYDFTIYNYVWFCAVFLLCCTIIWPFWKCWINSHISSIQFKINFAILSGNKGIELDLTKPILWQFRICFL